MWQITKKTLLFWRRSSEKELELLLRPEGEIGDPERINAEFRRLHRKGTQPGHSLQDTLEVTPALHTGQSKGESYQSPVVLVDPASGNGNGKAPHSSFYVDVPRGPLAAALDVGCELRFKYGDPRTTCYEFGSMIEEVGERALPHLGGKEFPVYRLGLPDRIVIKVLRRSYILDVDGDLRLMSDFRDKPFGASVLVHADRRLGEASRLMDRVYPDRINEYSLMDISVDALRLCSERRFKEGEEFDLTVYLPSDEIIHVHRARVTKSNIYSKVRGKPTIFTIFSYDQSGNHLAYKKIQSYINRFLTEKKKQSAS